MSKPGLPAVCLDAIKAPLSHEHTHVLGVTWGIACHSAKRNSRTWLMLPVTYLAGGGLLEAGDPAHPTAVRRSLDLGSMHTRQV